MKPFILFTIIAAFGDEGFFGDGVEAVVDHAGEVGRRVDAGL